MSNAKNIKTFSNGIKISSCVFTVILCAVVFGRSSEDEVKASALSEIKKSLILDGGWKLEAANSYAENKIDAQIYVRSSDDLAHFNLPLGDETKKRKIGLENYHKIVNAMDGVRRLRLVRVQREKEQYLFYEKSGFLKSGRLFVYSLIDPNAASVGLVKESRPFTNVGQNWFVSYSPKWGQSSR